MRQAGRYLPEYLQLRQKEPDFVRFCKTPAMCVEAALQPIRRFELDAAILFSDILLVPHAMGLALSFHEKTGPCLEKITEKTSSLEKRAARALASLEPVFEAVSETKARLPTDLPLIGFCGGPWTLACYMIEGGAIRDGLLTRAFARQHEAFFSDLLWTLSDILADYLSRQIQAGAQLVQIFDSWAGMALSSPDDAAFLNYIVEPHARLVRKLKEKTEAPVIGFPRLAGNRVVDYVKNVPVEAVALDQTNANLAFLNAQGMQERLSAKPSIVLQGALDPASLVAGGTFLKESVQHAKNTFSGKRWIANLAHGVHKKTPPESVSRLLQELRA